MKKTYIAPYTYQINIDMHAMICGSITDNGESLSVTLDDTSGSFGDNNTINSRGGSYWDED